MTKIDQLISAVESLQPVDSILQSYIFPMVMSLFGAALGAWLAIYSFKYQKRFELEKNKLDNVNQITLRAKTAYDTLSAMKINYCSRLDSNPYQRLFDVKFILFNEEMINDDVSGIAFIANYSGSSKKERRKWSNISRINQLFAIYNDLMTFWKKRNELLIELHSKMNYKTVDTGYQDISIDELYQSLNGPGVYKIIDLTEKVLMLTDEVIVQLHDFLEKFPSIAKTSLNVKLLKKQKVWELLSFGYVGKIQKLTIEKTTEPTFDIVEKLYGRTATEISNLYTSPFPK